MTKKVDYIMEILHKIISVLTVLACVAGLAWSCTNDADITASATIAVPDWAFPFKSYTDSYEDSLDEIQKQDGYLAHVLNDPNVSNEEKRQILIGNALQTFDFKFAADLIAHWNDDGFPTDPEEEVAVTGSGYAGLYYFDNVLYTGVLYPKPENWSIVFGASGYEPVCVTPHFTVGVVMEPVNGVTYYRGGNAYLCADGGNGKFRFDASAVFESYEVDGSRAQAFWKPFETVPRYYSSSTLLGLWDYFNGYKFFLGSTISVSLPSDTVTVSKPWEYYNNILLPYLRNSVYNSLSSNIDVTQLLVFPDGYYPQDPIEPPTLPNCGMTVNNNWNFNIGINNITVTDASGQPVTDASGETVTETVIETETRPTDAVYHFQIPTLTPLDTQVATIPPYQVPSEYAGYMSNVFTAITDFIDDAGLTDVAPVFLALAGIGIVIGVLL